MLSEYDDDPKARPIDKHEYEPARATCALLHITVTLDAPDGAAAAAAWVAAADEYFSHFVAPILEGDKGMRCFHCGDWVSGMMGALVSKGGGFQWGIAHGEGRCGNCGWPMRGHHYAKARDGGDLFTLRNYVLAYHPDEVTARDAEAP